MVALIDVVFRGMATIYSPKTISEAVDSEIFG